MIEKQTGKTLLIWLTVTAFLTGCTTMNPEWSTALNNIGKVKIEDSTIKLSRFYYRVGVLSPNSTAEFYCDHEAIPETAVIRWQRKGGPWQEKQVLVRCSIPRGFSGCIYFNIDDKDNVTILPEPE